MAKHYPAAYRTRLRPFPPSWCRRPGCTYHPLPHRPEPRSPAPARRPGITGGRTSGGLERPEEAQGERKGARGTITRLFRDAALPNRRSGDRHSSSIRNGTPRAVPPPAGRIELPASVGQDRSSARRPRRRRALDAPRFPSAARCVRAISRFPHERTAWWTAGSHLHGRPLRHRTGDSLSLRKQTRCGHVLLGRGRSSGTSLSPQRVVVSNAPAQK